MSRFLSTIGTSAFIFASLFNSQLTYNAELFASEPETVEARVRDNHTDKDDNNRFFEKAFDANMRELIRFYEMSR